MALIGFIPVIIIIIIVAVILASRSRYTAQSGSGTEGMSIARQIWLYLITLVALGIFAAGVGQLLALLFDVTIKSSQAAQIGRSNFTQQQLSLGLAMTVIGGPLWFLFWRAVQRRVKGNQEEIGAAFRKFTLNLILIVTAFTAIIAVSNFLKWLISGVPVAKFSSGALAAAIVAGIVWLYFWRVSEKEGYPSSIAKTLRRWYVYILSGFGLVWLAVGLVQLVNFASSNLPIWGDTLIKGQFWNNTTQMSLAQIFLGGVTWYFHWFRMAKDDYDSTLRQVYFYVLTISGGAIAALVASIIILFKLFLWIFGGAPVSISPHFQFLGWAVPTILVGLAIWGYHRRLAQEEAGGTPEKRQSTQRVYFYLMAFLGLGTMVAGICNIFGILFDTGTSLTSAAGWWRSQLAISLAFLLVGTPLWLYYWNGILKRVQTEGIAEWRSLSRRIFLYVVIGASIILLAADLVNIIYQLLRTALQGNFSADFLHSAKWSLQTVIVAVGLLWYHWQVLRADQRRGAESVVMRRNVTLLTFDRTEDLTSRLESKLGFKIRTLYQMGQPDVNLPALPEEELDRVANEILASPVNKVMLVVLDGKVSVLPYQDK